MSRKSIQKPPTVITLTLPESEGASREGTLLIQRGDHTQAHPFTYTRLADLTEVIAEALIALSAVEAELPASEPTVDIPLKRGKKTVRASSLQIVSGQADAAAYRQAVQIASLLIEGKLWDGDTPIRIDDVYALAARMKYLTARDLSLFTLTDFVQVGSSERLERTSS